MLVYVDDRSPGIHRVRQGRGFRYLTADGSVVRDASMLERIRSLVIPPAWKGVWICERETGHLQATGRDARGRKQYLYHPDWRELRDQAKYAKLIDFAKALPRIRQSVATDLRRTGLPREKVVAAIVRLMETTLIRVGNEEYARSNGSYGLTTMRDRHVHIRGRRICFEFRGKSGVEHEIELKNPLLAKIVRCCQCLPGQRLFQYRDATGRVKEIGSSDVNDYLRRISRGDFTAKDFRTWAGTTLAAKHLLDFAPAPSSSIAKRKIAEAIAQVAKQLGNTKTVCRKCYIHPAVLDSFLDGTIATMRLPNSEKNNGKAGFTLSTHERFVVTLIQTRLVSTASAPQKRLRVGVRDSGKTLVVRRS